MTEIIIVLVFLLWYLFSMIISENIGKSKKIGVEGSFLVCFLLSPVIGYLITMASPIKKN